MPNELGLDDVRTSFPEFNVEREIGSGSHKAAYQATRDSEAIVLKILLTPVAADDGPRSTSSATDQSDDAEEAVGPSLPPRVEREIEAMRGLSSQRVVRILAGPEVRTIRDGHYWWYLEPFYPGGTLAERIRRGTCSEAEALILLRALLEAVHDIWTQRGLVHRDIKPTNIVYDEAGEPILLDLGVVLDVHASPLTRPDARSPGTPRYLAPEQLMPRSYASLDARTDMFQVAVVVFEALTGKHPFGPFDGGFASRLQSGRYDRHALESLQTAEPLKEVLRRSLRPRQHERFREPSLALAALKEEA